MYNKEKIYDEVMSHVSYCGKTNVYYRLTGGLCGVVKGVIFVQVWETEDAITLVSKNESKITLPIKIIDLLCIMGESE